MVMASFRWALYDESDVRGSVSSHSTLVAMRQVNQAKIWCHVDGALTLSNCECQDIACDFLAHCSMIKSSS